MIRILIADDHSVVRRGIREILADQADMDVAGEAGTAHEVLDILKKQVCDVVVLDIGLPGRSGLEVLDQLREQHPKIPVLIHTMHPEEQFAVRAFRAGAAGYLTKDSAPTELVQALRKITSGRKYVGAALAEQLATRMDMRSAGPLHETLSDREFEVFRCMATGKTISEIGDQLSLSVKTISTYRARILVKLKMKNNAELMRYAMHEKIVD